MNRMQRKRILKKIIIGCGRIGQRRKKTNIVKVKTKNTMSQSDMLSASNILSVYCKGGKLDISNCTEPTRIYIEDVANGKSREYVEIQLQKLNKTIIENNEKSSIPTQRTKKIYRKLMREK